MHQEKAAAEAAIVTPGPAGPPVAAAVATPGVAVGAAVERRHFHVVNEANGSVLTVHRGDPKPGSKIHVDKKRPDRADHQIWFLDVEGVLRCKLNDFAICGKDSGDQVHLEPFTGDAREQWIVQGNRIVNRVFCNECLGLKKHLRLKDDAEVIASTYDRKDFQHWRIEPLVL